MTISIKYNTNSQIVPLGRFLDSTDGDTEETALTIANTDIKLWKSGATTLANKNSGGATHISNGIFYTTLDAVDSNTYGPMVIFVHVSGALAVRLECMVMEANAYDALMAALGTGYLEADARLISGDTVAADNLEATYDGTGYTNDEAPSKQSQLSSLANVGSAVHRPASSFTLTTGSEDANTYTATEALDAIRHELSDTAGAFEGYYEFNIGSGTPSSVQITGYITGGNDDINAYGYDFDAAAWVQVGVLDGKNSTADRVFSFDMFVDMVGSGANLGVVRIRFYAASGLTATVLAIDQVFVSFSQGLGGYEGGAVWLNTNASNTNTVPGVDGIPGNAVSTMAALNTLLAKTGLDIVEVAPGSSVTLVATQTGQIFRGHKWNLALGGQDVSGSHFFGATVSGIGTGTSEIDFHNCTFNTCTIDPFHIVDCSFNEVTITLGKAGTYVIHNSHSGVAGPNTPKIDTGAAIGNVNLSVSGWSNGFELLNLNASGIDTFSLSGVGQIIYALSCSGTVYQRGDWTVTNTGGVTIIDDDNTSNIASILTDTNELQGDLKDGGRLDLILDGILTDTADLQSNQGNWLTAVGFSTHAAADVWSAGTRTLTNAPTNWSAMVITAGGAVDALIQGYLNTLVSEITAGRIAGNFDTFFENADAATVKVVDNVGAGGGGGLTAQQTRDAMKLAPTAGTPSAGSVDEHLDDILADTGELQSNQNNWATATGFATSSALSTHDGKLDVVDSNVDAILADTGELQSNQNNWATATGFSTHGASDVWSVTTRLLSAGTNIVLTKGAGLLGLNDFDPATETVDIGKIAGSSVAVTLLKLAIETGVSGTVVSGTLSITEMTTDLTETTNDHFKGRVVIFTALAASLANQAAEITAYDGATKKLTFTGITEVPTVNDPFIII